MLEDIQATLSELDKVVFYFKQLDECFVASKCMPYFSCSIIWVPTVDKVM